jgi:hypothetical protein
VWQAGTLQPRQRVPDLCTKISRCRDSDCCAGVKCACPHSTLRSAMACHEAAATAAAASCLTNSYGESCSSSSSSSKYAPLAASSSSKERPVTHLVPEERSNPVSVQAIPKHRLPVFTSADQKVAIRGHTTEAAAAVMRVREQFVMRHTLIYSAAGTLEARFGGTVLPFPGPGCFVALLLCCCCCYCSSLHRMLLHSSDVSQAHMITMVT